MHPPRSTRTNPLGARLHGGLDHVAGHPGSLPGILHNPRDFAANRVPNLTTDRRFGQEGRAKSWLAYPMALPFLIIEMLRHDRLTECSTRGLGARARRIVMDLTEMREFHEIMKTIGTWEPSRRMTLIHRVLETLETEITGSSASPATRRGRSGAEIRADMQRDATIDAGPTPGTRPEDELIRVGAGEHPAATSPLISRGLSADEIRVLLKSKQPAPDDETVRQWIDDHRMEKYGR